ncbi:hypothetical protein Ciccas_011905, partial [Cichlidogyrus casuarinus]
SDSALDSSGIGNSSYLESSMSNKKTDKTKKHKKSRRQSKRELEEIVWEKHADLFEYEKAPNGILSAAPTSEMQQYISTKHHIKGSGEFRLLSTRAILKKGSVPWSVKARLLNVPYSQLQYCYIMPNSPEVLCMACTRSTVEEARYEYVRFEKTHQAEDCLSQLTRLGYGVNAMPEEAVHSPSNSSTPESVVSPKSLFDGECEFRQFDMRLFSEFPSELPQEVQDSLKDDHLDEKAHMTSFEDGVVITKDKSHSAKRLWSTNFTRVHRLYVDKKNERQFIFTVDDENNHPNHYNLVRMAKSHRDHEKMLRAYENRGGVVKTISSDGHSQFHHPDHHKKSPATTRANRAVSSGSDDSADSVSGSVMSLALSPVQSPPVIHMAQAPAVRSAYVPQEPSRDKKKAYSDANGFSTMKLRDLKHPLKPKYSINSKSELVSMPREDAANWDVKYTTIRNDPKGVEVDESGSIILFVARRIA